MRPTAFAQLTAQVYDAALTPELWPAALQAICDDIGAVGAAYIVRNRDNTSGIEWLSFTGPCAEGRADFVTHYAKHDPYVPLLDTAAKGTWVQLTRSLPEATLRRNEWYNEFLAKCGIGDILGIRIAETGSQSARFSLHQGVAQSRLAVEDGRFHEVLGLVVGAAQLQLELAHLRWKSAATLRALDEVAAGVMIADGEGKVIEMNRAAEHIARRGEGLRVLNERVSGCRSFESAKLAQLIAAATSDDCVASAARMLIERTACAGPYIVTIVPLGVRHQIGARPLALILIDDLGEPTPSEKDLGELFGLSPAETRLAMALARGKRLPDIAHDGAVQITTLRSQLSSVLKKVGVARQGDLLRVLARLETVRPNRS